MSNPFFKELEKVKKPFKFMLNTNTPLDYALGNYFKSGDEWYLNGGLSWIFGVVAFPQRYKSTIMNALLGNVLRFNKKIFSCNYDNESSSNGEFEKQRSFWGIEDDRIAMLTPESDLKGVLKFKPAEIKERLTFCDLDNLYRFIVHLIKVKNANKEEMMCEYPFLDEDGKKMKGWIPTFVFADSLSQARSEEVKRQIEELGISDSKNNMQYALENKKKCVFISSLSTLCPKNGLYFLYTGHKSGKIELNPRALTPKKLDFMKVSENIANIGKDALFLSTAILDNKKVNYLKTGDKSFFPYDELTQPENVSSVESIVLRGKEGAGSGGSINWVVSQTDGYLSIPTFWYYLKEQNYLGLSNNKEPFTPLLPDINLKRIGLRKLAETPDGEKVERALRVIAEYDFISKHWNRKFRPVEFKYSPREFAKKLGQLPPNVKEEIVNSRGYWTINEELMETPYMSLPKIIEIVNKG